MIHEIADEEERALQKGRNPAEATEENSPEKRV
jgi:hypothetical protein